MPHVLFLSYDGMTEPLGQSQVLPYIIGLTKYGYRFTLVSLEKKHTYAENSADVSLLCKQAGIEWHPIMYRSGIPIVSAIQNVKKAERVIRGIHKVDPIDFIHNRTLISGVATHAIFKKFGIPFLFDMRGFWADERIDGGLWPQNKLIFRLVYKYFKKLEANMISDAAEIIILTHKGKAEMLNWACLKGKEDHVSVIPCCADLSYYNHQSVDLALKAKLKESMGIKEDSFVLSYLGSLGTWYMLDEMLDFYQALVKRKPGAYFLFITAEPASNILDKAKAKGIAVDNIIIKRAPRREVPTYLSLSTLGIFFIKPSYSKQASSPVKQAEFMGMGIPTIVNSGVGDVDSITAAYNAGYSLKTLDQAAYDTLIDNLPQIVALPAAGIIKGATDYYSLSVGVESYLKAYRNIK